MSARQRVTERPTETIGGALVALASLAAYKAGADEETTAVVGVLAGLIPAAVTGIVTRGGLRGLARTLWTGRRG